MKLVIDHSNCEHGGAFSDRCLSKTMLYPMGHERTCLAHVEDDGKEEFTVTLREEGMEATLTFEDEEQAKAAAFEGWVAFEGEMKPV